MPNLYPELFFSDPDAQFQNLINCYLARATLLPKFHENSPATYWLIRLTARETKQTPRQTH